jgi:hypothetical protein
MDAPPPKHWYGAPCRGKHAQRNCQYWKAELRCAKRRCVESQLARSTHHATLKKTGGLCTPSPLLAHTLLNLQSPIDMRDETAAEALKSPNRLPLQRSRVWVCNAKVSWGQSGQRYAPLHAFEKGERLVHTVPPSPGALNLKVLK